MEYLPQSRVKVFLLCSSVFTHSFIMLSCLFFIVSYSIFNYSNKLIDLIVFSTCLSFIFYKKCVIIDIYDYIKNLDKNNTHKPIPDWAKDNFLRNKIKDFFNIEKDNKDYTQFRLDKLKNIEPILKNKTSQPEAQTMFNHKIHYLVSNVILIVLFLGKNRLNFLIPVFIYWILNIYEL